MALPAASAAGSIASAAATAAAMMARDFASAARRIVLPPSVAAAVTGGSDAAARLARDSASLATPSPGATTVPSDAAAASTASVRAVSGHASATTASAAASAQARAAAHTRIPIVFRSREFVVVNKPADVRIDGPPDITVEKLLEATLPAAGVTDKYRIVHQLDYATSGVMCFGLTRASAARAGRMFRQRRTRKAYVALVHGHVATEPPSEAARGIVRGSDDAIDDAVAVAGEGAGAGAGAGSGAGAGTAESASDGVDAAGAEADVIGDQQECWKCGGTGVKPSKVGKKKDKRGKVPRALMSTPTDAEGHASGAGTAPSGPVCPVCSGAGVIATAVAKRGGKRAPAAKRRRTGTGATKNGYMSEEDSQRAASVPVRAWLDALPAGVGPTFTVHWRIADTGDRVRMMVGRRESTRDATTTAVAAGSTAAAAAPGTTAAAGGGQSATSEPSPWGKHAMTTLTVLWRGTYLGLPVTKVLMELHTGRRHQLRVHCAALGHPIVGDVTYGSDPSFPRMMLHAWRLYMPHAGEGDGGAGSDSRAAGADVDAGTGTGAGASASGADAGSSDCAGVGGADGDVFEAPDPFVVGVLAGLDDGAATLALP